MPRYGLVGPDGKAMSDVILIPEGRKRGSAKQANAITALEQRAADADDGSKVVEFAQLPQESNKELVVATGDKLEWDDTAKKAVYVKQ